MKNFKVVIVGILAICFAMATTAPTFAAAQKGTITFVNTDHTYTYKLYSRNNVIVDQGRISNFPVVGQYEVGIYRFEIAHGDGRIERGQFTLANGQLLLITANLSTTSIASTPGNTTMRVSTGGNEAYDQGSSAAIFNPTVTSRQIGATQIDVVGEVTSDDTRHGGIDAILHDRFIPVTGFDHEDHSGAPGMQFDHVTSAEGTLARDYVSETYHVEFAVGNVMCLSSAPARDFEMCSTQGTRSVIGVVDENGDVIFSGIERIKVLGNVAVGDELIASSVPGFAVVDNTAAHGTVIATAMAGFTGNQGIITAQIGK